MFQSARKSSTINCNQTNKFISSPVRDRAAKEDSDRTSLNQTVLPYNVFDIVNEMLCLFVRIMCATEINLNGLKR